MNNNTQSIRTIWFLIAGVSFIIFAIIGFYLIYTSASRGYDKEKYSSTGMKIYYTGKGIDAEYIEYTKGPHWLALQKDRGCFNCHGEDGKGGYSLVATSAVATNITYNSLTGEDLNGDDETSRYNKQYTDKDIKKAITQGIEPSGERLSIIMPRWMMTDEEVNEIIEYLKEL
ncbi:c-type cytochrome [Candidatus Poribacteria bacterium]|nr:c-type cytochrome [Candidatus Poribacteria bacterium]